MPIKIKERPKEIFEINFLDEKNDLVTVKTTLRSINYIVNKMINGYSPIICIVGEQRIGKSYFAIWLGYTVCKIFGKKFDINKHTVYDPKQAIRKIKDIEREPFILDESSYSYYKREWYEKSHTVFSKIILTQGRKAICYIFVSPFIRDIDKSFGQHFHIIIKVKKRGLAKVFYKKRFYSEMRDKDILVFMDDISLSKGDIPKEIWDQYDKFSNNEKDKIENELEQISLDRDKLNFKQILRRL